jgi:hypothetical protein
MAKTSVCDSAPIAALLAKTIRAGTEGSAV